MVLEKSLKISLKNGCNFLYEPCKSPLAVDARVAQNVFAELAPYYLHSIPFKFLLKVETSDGKSQKKIRNKSLKGTK